jgi:hypothetical protein
VLTDWLLDRRWRLLGLAGAALAALAGFLLVALPLGAMHEFSDLDRTVALSAPLHAAGSSDVARDLCDDPRASAALFAVKVRSAAGDERLQLTMLNVAQPRQIGARLTQSSVVIAASGAEPSTMAFLARTVRETPALFFSKVSLVSAGDQVILVVNGSLVCDVR